jgi:hypothetical protein
MFQLLRDSACLPRATWTIFPLLNPEGYSRRTRENTDGFDLNRDYRYPTANESTAHHAVIDKLGPIDHARSLYKDWESIGFYIYELNSTGKAGIAEAALGAAGKVGLIDLSEIIDGRPTALSRPGKIISTIATTGPNRSTSTRIVRNFAILSQHPLRSISNPGSACS